MSATVHPSSAAPPPGSDAPPEGDDAAEEAAARPSRLAAARAAVSGVSAEAVGRAAGRAIGAVSAVRGAAGSAAKTAALASLEAVEAGYGKLSEERRDWVESKASAGATMAATGVTKAARVGMSVVGGMRRGQEEAEAAMSAAMDAALTDEQRAFLADRREYVDTLKQRALAHALEMADGAVDDALAAVERVLIRRATSDADMPNVVRRGVAGAIGAVWPDVAQEVKRALHSTVRRRASVLDGERPSGCLGRLRAWLLYAMFPYDRSLWGRLRSRAYLPVLLLTMLPWFGTRVFYFALLLLCIDRRDEYQLVRFIMALKGAQFLSGGVIAALLGAFRYYGCVNWGAIGSCATSGPGALEIGPVDLAAYVLQVILVWAAFLALPYSVKKGEALYKGTTSGERAARDALLASAERGGADSREQRRLRRLLLWDLFAFLASAALLLVATFTKAAAGGALAGMAAGDVLSHWVFRADLFWAKVIYSLLSLPFFVFNLPLVKLLLTHTRATGYTPNGHCVPLVTPRALTKGDEEEGGHAAGEEKEE